MPDGRRRRIHDAGDGRSGRGEALREFEFIRFAAGADGVPAYLAQPGGGAPVAFRLVDYGAMHATFENRTHDYPQRVHYVRDGTRLTAMISAIDGIQARSWTYQRR